MPRLLIVDDEEGVRDVLSEYFATQLGYDVTAAGTGVAAIASIRTVVPDVVLLDLSLVGELDGAQVLGVIRERWPTVLVIMVTANISEELARLTLAMGAFDYVMKPFDMGRLADIVAIAAAGFRRVARTRSRTLLSCRGDRHTTCVVDRVRRIRDESTGSRTDVARCGHRVCTLRRYPAGRGAWRADDTDRRKQPDSLPASRRNVEREDGELR